jgi:hypothetical protein
MAEYISVTGDELKLGRHVRLRVLAHLKHAAPHHCLAPEPGKVPSDFYTLAVRLIPDAASIVMPDCIGPGLGSQHVRLDRDLPGR